MAALFGSAAYDADLWDLQSAIVETNKTQLRPISTDLEDLFFDCSDVPMQHNEIPTSGSSLRTPETGSDEIVAVQKGEVAHGPWHDYDMHTAESLVDLGKQGGEEAGAMQTDSQFRTPMHDHDMFVTDPWISMEQVRSKEAEAIPKDPEAQNLMYGHDTFAAGPAKGPGQAKPEEVEAVQKAEEAQHASEDSEPEFEEGGPSQKHQATERKREYKRKFDKWARQHAKIITDEEIRLRKPAAADESLSIHELMQKDQQHIITDPREYQLELFERAKKQNIIAVLDTGSGKTLIAVLLLRHIIDQELEDRAVGKNNRTAFFLVDSVALVFQQFEVLNTNLDQSIARFCGDMNTDLWAKETWQTHLKENMVIVCTAEILYQCLMHSFISIDQINLLIFDEAHHAKKNHAYARIIKDFYVTEHDRSKRPRVFGMTASPVDVRSDFTQATKDLEAMLHCQIATTTDLALLRTSVSRPNESIAEYQTLLHPYETDLCRELRMRYGDMESLAKIFKHAKEAASELGEWCADQVFLSAMSEKQANILERKVEKDYVKNQDARPIEMLDEELKRLREVQDFVSNWKCLDATERHNGLSPKVLVLRRYLELIFERPTDARCIVFVDKRYSARLLSELFARIGSPHLRPGKLVGARNGQSDDADSSVRQQILTLNKFRKGILNCLFATSIAEEGLDIPECNLVIRFDLYRTLIQYIQSRGRARHVESKYIHMVEKGNRWHLQSVRDVRKGEEVMRLFCESLPADRLLQGNEHNLDATLDKEKNLRVFIDPTSGAKLTYASSLVILAHFVSCLPEASSPPNYMVSVEHGQYTCEVVLPESSPVHSASGRPSSKKSLARRSAAFEACLLLRQGGHLDENLLSTHHRHLPAMRNAHLALNMNKSSNYDMRIKPLIWQETRGSSPTSLYMTIFSLDKPENLGRTSQPMALLTRSRMPAFPSVLLHLHVDRTSNLNFDSSRDSFSVSKDDLEKLNAFTLRIYKDVYNKKFEVNTAAMSYWFAPISKDYQGLTGRQALRHLLDWKTIDYVYENDFWEWSIDAPAHELENRYLVDRWDGGRRFWSLKVLPHLGPDDPVPHDAASHKYMASILDYSVSLFPKARKKAVWRHDQPVIHAHRILHRLNWLDELTEKEVNVNNVAYVCPEPLLFSAVSPIPVLSDVCCSHHPSFLLRSLPWRISSRVQSPVWSHT